MLEQTWARICAGLAVLFSCLYVNCLSQVLIERYYLAHARRNTLFDLGFEFLPFLTKPRIPDGMLVGALVFILSPLIFFHPKRTQIARRFLAMAGLIYLSRAFTVIATILPNPEKTCETHAIAGTNEENILIEALKTALGLRVTCGDCLFSGHTASMNLTTLLANRYGRHFVTSDVLWGLLRGLLWAYSGITYIFIVCTHFHYTIDVTVAVMVSTAVWKWYHSYIRYIKQLPQWHPIVWYEFDIEKQDGPISTAVDLDDPEAPLLLTMKLN